MARRSKLAEMITSPELEQAKKTGDFSAILDKVNKKDEPAKPVAQEEEEEVPNDPVPYPDENGNMVIVDEEPQYDQSEYPDGETEDTGSLNAIEIVNDIIGLQKTVERMTMEIDLNSKKLKEYEAFINKVTEENKRLTDLAERVPNLTARVKELEIENARLDFENSRKDSIIASLQAQQPPPPPQQRRIPQPQYQPSMTVQGRMGPPPRYNTNGYESWN